MRWYWWYNSPPLDKNDQFSENHEGAGELSTVPVIATTKLTFLLYKKGLIWKRTEIYERREKLQPKVFTVNSYSVRVKFYLWSGFYPRPDQYQEKQVFQLLHMVTLSLTPKYNCESQIIISFVLMKLRQSWKGPKIHRPWMERWRRLLCGEAHESNTECVFLSELEMTIEPPPARSEWRRNCLRDSARFTSPGLRNMEGHQFRVHRDVDRWSC